MTGNLEHLTIERESLKNDRRTRRISPPQPERGSLRDHGRWLVGCLERSANSSRQQVTSRPGSYVLKLRYSGLFDTKHLDRHGIEFISQEDKQLCVVFTDERGLSIFSDHLNQLGLDGVELTYKQILEAIDGIDNWTPEDRKSWAITRKGLPVEDQFDLDIELWPVHVAHHPARLEFCNAFEGWLHDQHIRRIDKVNLDSLVIYRVSVNANQAELLLNHVDVRLVDLVPTSGISYQELNCDIDTLPGQIPHPPAQAARVCILDSGIATNHPLIAPAVAESISFVDGEEPFDLNGHGTAVAGIALYGDLDGCNASNYWQPELWLYNGKILDQNAEFDHKTIEKTLTEAVAYFVDEHQCRIFNLSIGNANAPYDQHHIRGIAYVLDELARRYNVLFVVSAGNFSGSVDPDVPRESWRDEYPEYLASEQNVIIDPAPALNVLTVGSLARHNASFDEQRYPEIAHLSPAGENQPSPFTRRGPSVKGAIKPDLMAVGGNLASPVRSDGYQTPIMRGMGVLTCNRQFVGNTLFSEISGTSFASPYVTHLAGRLLNNYPQASANLLRAMLVNHASVPHEVESTFSPEMKDGYKKICRRDVVRDMAGYGLIDDDALYRSSQHVVVMMAEENIDNDAHHFFELPLPEEFLRTELAAREIRVTLAYSPAVRTTRLDYVATKMNFKLVKDESLEAVQMHFNHETQSETDTRSDDASGNRDIGPSLRDKGTVQSATWSIRRRNPTEKWFVVVTRQDREWGAAMSLEQEPYALVVTVTDRENENARLYTQISQRIEQQQRARAHIE
jgi:hypothetical protein